MHTPICEWVANALLDLLLRCHCMLFLTADNEFAGELQTLTVEEVDELARQTNADVYQGLYTARRAALDALVEEYLLEREAKRRGITIDELVEAEITGKVAAISDADVEAFYNANRARVGNRSLEDLSPMIRNYLAVERENEVRTALFDRLKDGKSLRVALQPPRVEVTIAANDPYQGPADAPVTIVEYSDFQ